MALTAATSERSYAPLTDAHLCRLAEIAAADRADRFARLPHLRVYRDRLLLVALCQGAALHYLDGRNGVKDLDVWTFYAAHSQRPYPYRSRKMRDFGPSELGRHPDDRGYLGRHVDLIGRSIDATPGVDPVSAVRRYLRTAGPTSAKALGELVVVAHDVDPTDDDRRRPACRDAQSERARRLHSLDQVCQVWISDWGPVAGQ